MVDKKGRFWQKIGLMLRPLRVQFPGAIYHLISRGDRCTILYEAPQRNAPCHSTGSTLNMPHLKAIEPFVDSEIPFTTQLRPVHFRSHASR